MPQRWIPLDKKSIASGSGELLRDPWLGELARTIELPSASNRKDPFHALIVSILNQQISRIAAKAIETRLAQLAGSPFQPEPLAKISVARLRKAGLSETKANCVRACSRHALKNELSAKSCRGVPDEQIMDRLCQIKGIGPWSSQMVLLFGLGRPDIMPDGDGGIVRAASILFDIKDRTKAREKLVQVSPTWAPHRTLAAWYLWRSLGG